MGARTSTYRQGGGFLNNVDGVITGYTFTDEFNGQPFVPGKNPKDPKKDKFHSLYARLAVRVDGADDDIYTTLFVGGYDDFAISEDGAVITRVDGEGNPADSNDLGASSAFTILIQSLVKAGFDDTRFSETENDFRPMIGARCHFVQKTNEEATKKLGKRKDPKTGKEYNRQDLVVDVYYGQVATPGVAAKTNKPAAGKSATKPVAAPAAIDVNAKAEEILLTLLTDDKVAPAGSLPKAKLSALVVSRVKQNEGRDEVRKLIMSNDFLQTQNGWAFDGTTVSLPTE